MSASFPVKKFAPYLLGLMLALLHAGLFILLSILVSASREPEAGMAYYLFWVIDAPIAKYDADLGWILIMGTLWWFCCGFAVQSLFLCRQKGGFLRLAVSLVALGLLFLSPNLRLLGKPSWEQAYIRGTQAANSGDTASGVRHLHEAIRLAGPENEFTISLYSYLGGLCVSLRDYDQAVEAAKTQVALALKRSGQRTEWDVGRSDAGPHQVMDAYNDLSTACRLAGQTPDEKTALLEAAKWDRIVFGGDSIQEANCWDSIAEITFNEGNRTTAIQLLEKAQAMSAKFEPADSFTMTYINERLTEWKAQH